MSLPDQVAIKYSLYTLACHEFLRRWQDLQSATQENDLGANYEDIFEKVLVAFFQLDLADTVEQATEQFGSRLLVEAKSLRVRNENVAEIFDDLTTTLHNQAHSWCYKQHIEDLHMQGRSLAHAFFIDSPHLATRKRLDHVCQLCFEYDDSTKQAPMAYRNTTSHVLNVRFSFSSDFTTYLLYPFQFLHEYTAHVYAYDNGFNQAFHDGWMIHAAAKFLEQQGLSEEAKRFNLHLAQTDVFYMRAVHNTFDAYLQRACHHTRLFDSWLSSQLPQRFQALTCEMIAFQPRPEEPPTWITKFINKLYSASIRGNPAIRVLLLESIDSAADVRELMQLLHDIDSTHYKKSS